MNERSVVVYVSGGMVQNVQLSHTDMDVYVVDYDVDCEDPEVVQLLSGLPCYITRYVNTKVSELARKEIQAVREAEGESIEDITVDKIDTFLEKLSCDYSVDKTKLLSMYMQSLNERS